MNQGSNATWIFEESAPAEGVRLLVAFLQISDPATRLRLIEQAEQAAQMPPRHQVSRLSIVQDNLR